MGFHQDVFGWSYSLVSKLKDYFKSESGGLFIIILGKQTYMEFMVTMMAEFRQQRRNQLP